MKPLYYYFTILIAFTLLSCGGNKSAKNNKESTEINKEVNGADQKEAKDCDEFIDQYEEWMDKYLALIEKYTKNPTDVTVMQEYIKISEEALNWVNQWNSKFYHCASREKYQKRFDEISDKAEKKLKELGLE